MIENSFKFKFSKKYFYFGMWPFVITCWLNCRVIVPSPAFNTHWSQVAKTYMKPVFQLNTCRDCLATKLWRGVLIIAGRRDIILKCSREYIRRIGLVITKIAKYSVNFEKQEKKKKKRKWNGKYIYMIVTSRMWQCAKALLQLSKFSLSVADLEDYRVAIFCFV